VWDLQEEKIERSLEYFERAVELDPNFALAYAHLESCYMEAFTYKRYDERAPKADAAARRALEIDDNLAEAHFAFGDTLWHGYDFDGFEKEMKRGLELNPNNALAHMFLGLHRMLLGAFDEAQTEMRKAIELDPLSPLIRYFNRVLLCHRRQYDEALEDVTVEMKLYERPRVRNWLADVYLRKGDYEKALLESEKAVAVARPDDRPFLISTLACIYAKEGRKDEATRILNELEEASKQRYLPREHILAPIYYCLGNYDETFRIWQEAYDEHLETLPFSLTDPFYDELRSDPRFVALLKKVGLQK